MDMDMDRLHCKRILCGYGHGRDNPDSGRREHVLDDLNEDLQLPLDRLRVE
jgi:hypothetical protein